MIRAITARISKLAKEVRPLGISVTVVAPGAFRTGFRGPESIKQSATRIGDYDGTAGRVAPQRSRAMVSRRATRYAARSIIAAVEVEKPLVHLLIGGDVLDKWQARLDAWRQEIGVRETFTRDTDF